MFPASSFGMPTDNSNPGLGRAAGALWVREAEASATPGFVPSLGIGMIPAAPAPTKASGSHQPRQSWGRWRWRRCLPQRVGGKCPSSTKLLCLVCFRAKADRSVALLPQSLSFQPILLIRAALIPSKPRGPQEPDLGEVMGMQRVDY